MLEAGINRCRFPTKSGTLSRRGNQCSADVCIGRVPGVVLCPRHQCQIPPYEFFHESPLVFLAREALQMWRQGAQKIREAGYTAKSSWRFADPVRVDRESGLPGVRLVLRVICTVRRINVVHKVSIPAGFPRHLLAQVGDRLISERHHQDRGSARPETAADAAKGGRFVRHPLQTECADRDIELLHVVRFAHVLEREGHVGLRGMVRLRKLDHVCGAVYADDTALRYAQGELMTYSAVATTHIEHSFVAVETVARQYGHRDRELNVGIGAVTAWLPMCRRIVHWRRRSVQSASLLCAVAYCGSAGLNWCH